MILNNIGHWFTRGAGQCLEKTLSKSQKSEKKKPLRSNRFHRGSPLITGFKPQIVIGEHGLNPGPNN